MQWCPDRASVFGSCAEDGLLNVWDYEKVRVFCPLLNFVCSIGVKLVLIMFTFLVPVTCTFEIILRFAKKLNLNHFCTSSLQPSGNLAK